MSEKNRECHSGGQMVSVLAFHSDDTSLNPALLLKLYFAHFLTRTKINKKRQLLCTNIIINVKVMKKRL